MARQRTARQIPLPAPTAGWNTISPLAQMNASFAPQLTNWYPREGQLELRGGSIVWASGLGGPVLGSAVWSPTSGASKMFGITAAGIFDCTAGGAVGAAGKTCTNADYSNVLVANSAGNHFLWMVNGVDAPVYFDGTSWTNPALTFTGSAVATDLIQCWLFKRRIWSVRKNSQSVGYMDIDSIAGEWIEFPVGALLKRGGYVVAGTSWTVDGGDGADDLLVIISSEGEVLVYQGSSPSSASSFQLIGTYYIGKPLSKHCFEKIGGDVAVATHRGLFPLSAALSSAAEVSQKAMSRAIEPSWTGLAKGRVGNPGWQMTVFPFKEALIINMPSPGVGDPTQIVFNLTTGACCNFDSWDAGTIFLFNEQTYYGDAAGNVVLCWSPDTSADKGNDIVALGQQAPTYLGAAEVLKLIGLLRFQLSYDAGVEFSYAIGVDFEPPSHYSTSPRSSTFLPAVWDVSLWDVSFWQAQATQDRAWRHVGHAPGYAISLYLRIATKFAHVTWTGTDLTMTVGAGLG